MSKGAAMKLRQCLPRTGVTGLQEGLGWVGLDPSCESNILLSREIAAAPTCPEFSSFFC